MAKELVYYGYTAPQYYYWSTLDDGGKYISNGATNYVKKYYDYYWDYPKKKVYYDDEGWDWEYIYVNGNHPTVSGSGAKLTGTGKADSIRNGGDKANINAGAGNDDIYNSGDKANINGGAGKDTIGNGGSNVSINATADSKGDFISNYGKKVKIAAGGGSDRIENYGSLVTIFSGAGNDNISNGGDKVTIETGTGKDKIENHGSNVSINATADAKADSISNRGDKVTILAGAGDDTITNREGDNVKIYAGDGDNLISIVDSKNVTLQTGNNLDSVVIDDLSSVSIQSGAGKNFISLKGDNSVSISGGENEIHFDSSRDIVYTDDENASITVFFDSSGYPTLNTGSGDDTVWIKESSHRSWWNDPFVVDTGYQNDSIRNEAYSVSIETGYGKDSVENWGGQVTIQSGDPDITAGKNLIKNHVDDVTIQGGGQADTIENYTGRNVSINGGRGNDVIKLYSTESMENLLAAALNPLLNVVKDFNLEKINSIIDIYNTLAEAIDGFEKVSQLESSYKGKNQIKIRDRLQKISDKAGELDEALEKSEEFLESAGCGTDKISVLRKSTDKIQQVAGKGIKFSDNTEIVAGMMKEYADNKIWSTVGKELTSDFEKIDGRLSFVAKKPVGTPTTVHGGKGNDKIYSDERKFHVYEYTAGDGSDTIFSWNLNDTLSISGGSYTGEIVNGDYVVRVGKGSVTFKNYTSRDHQQVIVGDSYERLPCQIEGQEANGGYHAAQYFYNQPATPPPEGINIDYSNLTVEENFSGEINLAKNYASYVTRVDASNAAGNVEIIGSDSTENIRAGKGNDNIGSSRSFTVIHSGAGKDIVSSSGDGNSINSGADNDVIVNVGNENSIDAGTGNDTIISDGKKNIFLVNDGGNKVIYGFGVKDTLRITDSDGTFSTKNNGDDIIVTGDGVKITLAGAAGLRKVNIKASKITGRKIENSYANEMIQGTDKADTIENYGSNVTIAAGAGNDSIRNGGDTVTILGGKGNDYVDDWGGIGTAYVYSAGNDTIDGFNEWDTIVLGSVKANSSVRADDGTVTLNLSNKKTLTLKNYWLDKINLVKSIDKVKKINVTRNWSDNVSISGSNGVDYIDNGGDNTSISGDKGNDYIHNYGDNVTISGGDGNDTFNTWGENTGLIIQGGAGNDYVHNNAHNSIIDTGDGDDTIGNWGENAHNNSINSGAGADDIDNNGSNVTIDAGAGDDTIYNTGYFGGGQNVSINSGEGSDSIYNYRDSVTIAGGADNDFINNSGENVMFNYTAGDGNDRIEGFNETSTLQIGGGSGTYSTQQSGNDIIVTVGKGKITLVDRANWDNLNIKGKEKTSTTNDGADYIENNSVKKTISSGKGNDTIKNWADNVTIDAGANDDNIENNRNNVSINSGSGNDFINNTAGKNVTISGGKGNDLVHTNQWDIGLAYVYTSGNDTINGLTEWSTLVIKDKYTLSRDYYGAVVITVEDKGTITLPDYPATDVNIVSSIDKVKRYNTTWSWSNNTVIAGASKDDYVFNGGNNVTINGFAGNDYIEGNGSNVTMNGGDGNDKFFNGDYLSDSGNSVLINGDAGDDSITNGGDNSNKGLNVTMNGGAGKDYLRNYGNSVTINGGTGNDYIRNGVNPAYLTSFSMGSNVIINGGDGSDRIENATSTNVTITGGSGDDTIDNYLGNSVSINGGSGNDVIENSGFNATILGGKGNDTVWNSEAGMVYVYKSGEGNDYISGFGILETLVVDGAKYSTVKSEYDVFVKVGKNTITLEGAAGLANVNIVSSTKNITPVNVVENSTEKKTIKGKSSSNWIRNYASNVTINGGKNADDIYNNGSNVVIKGGGGYDQIRSYSSNVSILGGSKADLIYSYGSDNTVNAGTGNDTLYTGGNVQLIYANGDGKDIIQTSNGLRGGNLTVNLTSGTLGTTSISDAGDIVINVGKGSLTFKNAQGDKVSVKDSKGKTTVVNAGRTATENTKNSKTITKTKGNQYISNSGSKVKITTGAGSDGIENYGSQVTINSAAGNDNLHNEGNNVSINTGASNDYIENYGNKTTILGGKGNDNIYSYAMEEWNSKTQNWEFVKTPDSVSIDGGAGNDYIYINDCSKVTISGGKGNDTISAWSSKNALIKYTSGDGNDMIWNFNETSTLQVSGGYYSTQKSGDNVIVTVGKGNVTLTNVANLSKLNIKGNKGLIITDSIQSPVTADSDIKVIDASARTKAIKITGNALANSISGGTKNDSIFGAAGNDSILGNAGNDKLYGEAGNDIIYGGKGNDSLWGGANNDSLWGDAGNDTFFYTVNEGTDKIFDFETGDMLQILNADGSDGSFKSSKYSGGDLTLSINGGGKIIFDDVASTTKFNINGSSYHISGSKLVKK